MFQLVVTFWLLSLAAGAFVPNFSNGKIVLGRNTSIEEVPYQVAIETDEGDQFCGGSIITTKHVLTAAHCFSNDDETKVAIRTGSSLLGTGGTVIKAAKVVTHPKYNSSVFDYDVVVIELEEEIRISNVSQIIGLAKSEPMENTMGLISGWGRLELAGGPSDQLQSITIPVVNHQRCKESYPEDNPVTDRMICAGGGETGACKGDSGGALVVETDSGSRVVAGIISWIGWHGCAHLDYYNVFADVSNPEIRDFIREQAGV